MPQKPIELSPRYGVNAAIPKCFFCQQNKPEIIMMGRIRTAESDDAEAPRDACWDKTPCAECAVLMSKGVMLIGAEEKLSDDPQNPYRTGNRVVVTDEAYKRMFDDLTVLETRVAFVSHESWLALGLPTTDADAAALGAPTPPPALHDKPS